MYMGGCQTVKFVIFSQYMVLKLLIFSYWKWYLGEVLSNAILQQVPEVELNVWLGRNGLASLDQSGHNLSTQETGSWT